MTGEYREEVVEKDTELNNDAWEDTDYYVIVVDVINSTVKLLPNQFANNMMCLDRFSFTSSQMKMSKILKSMPVCV